MAKNIHYKDFENKDLDLLPIRRGCTALKCCCLGICEDIVGYIPRKDYTDFIISIPSLDGFLSKYVKTNQPNNN